MIGCLIDFTRLGVYSASWQSMGDSLDWALLTAAVLSAFTGAFLGNVWLKKMTMGGIQKLVAVLLILVAVGLASGVL